MFSETRSEENEQFKRIDLKQQNALQSIFETTKSYIKSAYKTYLFLNPEVKMAQCLVKVFYVRYPGLMRFLRTQNLSKLVRRLYFILTKYMNNILNGNVFSWYESEAVKTRVGSKIAAITTYEYVPPQRKTLQPTTLYNLSPHYIATLSKTHALRRSVRQATNTHLPKNSNRIQPQMRSTPKQISHEIKENKDMDSEARIDLTNQSLQIEADQLFNIDSMFWKSLGIEENSIKRYSMAYCAKEYATDAVKRFVRNVLLS